MTKNSTRLSGVILAASLAISGTACVPAGTDLISEKAQDNACVRNELSGRLIDALLKEGSYAQGEAVVTVNASQAGAITEDSVFLAEVDRSHILNAVSGRNAGGSEYESLVRARLADAGNSSEDHFQILLVRDPGRTAEELLRDMYDIPQVIMAEPNYLAHAAAEEETDTQCINALAAEGIDNQDSAVPDTDSESRSCTADLSFLQWYVKSDSPSVYSTPAAPLHAGYSLNVPGWNTDQENASGTVCVMDTGIDTTHPDLKDVLYTFTEEQQKAYGCGPHGINVNTRQMVDGTSIEEDEEYQKDVSDHFMHGTHIAGMIGAAWNQHGVSGIANGARVFAVRLTENDGMGQGASDVLKGFEWLCEVAEDVNLKAVNVSLGSMKPQLIHTVMANKLGELGVNTVYASGNSMSDLDETIDMGGQNNSPYVIVVNAADMDGKKAAFSNYGLMSTDVFAPGTQILSTVPEALEQFTVDGILTKKENRKRFFPEAAEKTHPEEASVERFDRGQSSVRFFNQCPVTEDGLPNPDAEEIGKVSTQAGYDDDYCWSVPYSSLQHHTRDDNEEIWMPQAYSAERTLWIAIPCGEYGSPDYAAVKASLSDGSHINAGLTGVLCEKEETDGTLHPAAVDMRYDIALSSRELHDHKLAPGIGVTMTMGISATQWSELSVDLKQFVKETVYYHENNRDQAADSDEYDLEYPVDPGQIDGIFEWDDNGQKYLLLEYGISSSDAPGDGPDESMQLYFDNIAAGCDSMASGAYESVCGTSMAAPCVTASLAVIARDEPKTSDMAPDERRQTALERKAKLLAAVDYDDDLSKLCSTGGRVNLNGQTEYTRKAPLITDASAEGQTLTVRGYFFGASGELYIDGDKLQAAEWTDRMITADIGMLQNGTHEVKIINEDGAVFRRLFASSASSEGRRLYERTWPLPLNDDTFTQDQADGLFGMAASDGFLYAMAVYGLEQASALWRMNLETQEWSRCADLPDTVRGRSMENNALVPYQGRLYCYTTRTGLEKETPSLWAYDPAADSWDEAMSGQLCRDAQLFALEDGLFLVTDAPMDEAGEDETEEDGTESHEAADSETESLEAADSETESLEAVDSETESHEAVDSETESFGAEGSETEGFLVDNKITHFYRADLDAGVLIPVSGSLPLMDSIYTCHIASCHDVMYLLGTVGTEDGEKKLLLRMAWNAEKESFEQEDLSDALPKTGKTFLSNMTMKGYGEGIALVFTSEAGPDTFILKDGTAEFEALDQVSCYRTMFEPTSAYADGWLYVLALNATEPEVAYLRSTRIVNEEE